MLRTLVIMDEQVERQPEAEADVPTASQIRDQHVGQCFIVRLSGEFDIASASHLEGHLCGLVEQGHVVVDLSKVQFVDSAVLRAMILAQRRATVLGHGLHLARAQGTVRQLLEITRLDKYLDAFDDVGDAIETALATAESRKG